MELIERRRSNFEIPNIRSTEERMISLRKAYFIKTETAWHIPCCISEKGRTTNATEYR